MSERVREGEVENPTLHCKHVSLGKYKVTSGTYKGSLKTKQGRCRYCAQRMKANKESGNYPPTCLCCSFHGVAVCRKYNCWQRHLSEVEKIMNDEFAI